MDLLFNACLFFSESHNEKEHFESQSVSLPAFNYQVQNGNS